MKLLLFGLFILIATAASVYAKKLTPAAGLTGAVLAVLIYFGVGWNGIAVMGAFFILGTLATSVKKKAKRQMGLTQEGGGRTTGQVLANGGAAAVLGFLAILFPNLSSLCLLLIAAAFSSATADTLSSELGSVYGKKFYDILSFKKSPGGPDGVISAEGLAFGIAGSSLIATVYAAAGGWSDNVVWIVVAGTAGNLADSYLGATLERNGLLGNDAVNFCNTAFAVAVMLSL